MESKVDRNLNLYDGKAYALTSNIMLTAIVILLFTVILIICLHLYCHCYLRRARHRHRPRQGFNVFYVHPITSDVPPHGLDPSVIQSLPVFLYSSDTHPHSDPVECTICLSAFEENESGRVLPKCNHTFHVECIDMWFEFHSTCPVCRSLVEPAPPGGQPGPEVVIDVCEPGSSSECQQHDGEEENQTSRTLCSSSSSIGLRRKPSLGRVTLSRSFGREVEESTTSFRSPMSRILSLKRIFEQ